MAKVKNITSTILKFIKSEKAEESNTPLQTSSVSLAPIRKESARLVRNIDMLEQTYRNARST